MMHCVYHLVKQLPHSKSVPFPSGPYMLTCILSKTSQYFVNRPLRVVQNKSNGSEIGVMNGPLKFLTARKILPLLDLLAKFKRVLACSCSPNICVARKLAKQIFYFCWCSQKNRSARHARKCSQRPFVTPRNARVTQV